MPEFRSEHEFQIYAEEKAAEFARFYGAERGWTNQQLEKALADHGLPDLLSMPDYDDSTAARERRKNDPEAIVRGPYGSADSPIERYRWRRLNATHILGHVILEHPPEQIATCTCQDWGKIVERMP